MCIAPYSEHEVEVEVEKALVELFSEHEECSFDHLFALVGRDPRVAAAGRGGVTRALELMEVANKVMYREGRVHLI